MEDLGLQPQDTDGAVQHDQRNSRRDDEVRHIRSKELHQAGRDDHPLDPVVAADVDATLVQFKEGIVQRKQDAEQREREKARAEAAQVEATARAQREAEEVVVRTFGEGFSRLSNGDLTFRLSGDIPPAYRKLQGDFNEANSGCQRDFKVDSAEFGASAAAKEARTKSLSHERVSRQLRHCRARNRA